jgi:AcrR family transcriptional regulator
MGFFERKGFEEATIAEIADAAEVSPRTLFRYYAHKEDLVFAPAEEFRTVLAQGVMTRPPVESSFEALKNALLEYGDYIERQRERVLRGMRLIADSPTLRRREAEEVQALTATLVDGIAARRGAEEPALQDLTAVLLALACATAAFRSWVARPDPPLPHLLTEAFAVAEREVCASLT